MSTAPVVVVFDVNETLSDTAPMGRRFAEVGAPELLAKVWFASVLRDGFALAAAGAYERFATVAPTALHRVLAGVALTADLDDAVDHVMAGFFDLDPYPDVAPGLRALAGTGARLVTLSNGSVEIAERLLERAGARRLFDQLLSVDGAGVWKPAPAAYAYAARACASEPAEMLLVAVHPWDIDGASRAGLHTAWLDRRSEPYPGFLRAPDVTVSALAELADHL